MSVRRCLVLCAVIAAMHTRQAGAQTVAHALHDIAFMAGCWRGEPDERGTSIEERYTPPAANLMLGVTRYLRGDSVVMYEFTRIEATEGGIVLTPFPRGRESVPFRLVSFEGGRAMFENRDHDFPNRIIYVASSGGLVARIENLQGRGQEWRMNAVPCSP